MLLRQRPWDILILGFFTINLLLITYIVDLEQLVIADPSNFEYPIWPLPFMIDIVHWWARNFDPVILARPVWWKATIWIDALLFGPFYAVAIYAFIKRKAWIKLPATLWAGVMMTNVTIILSEEFFGPNATSHSNWVLAVNLPWLLFPVLVVWRLWRRPEPFQTNQSAI